MPLIAYKSQRFNTESLRLINTANRIITEYDAQGFKLTLRQLYYQFVSRDIIPNTEQSYKRLGSIINDARLAGEIDWDSIEDRLRNLVTVPSWDETRDIINDAADWFQLDYWDSQDTRIEVWVEKDALTGVIEPTCNKYRVPYFACRGYCSQSEAWSAGQRFIDYKDRGQRVVVLHLGDHDPSGIDMTRDNRERLEMFADGDINLIRLALNSDQVRKYNPPPNPAKITDSRAPNYIAEFGQSSWELDALEPRVIADLLNQNIRNFIDIERWNAAMEKEQKAKAHIRTAASKWKEPK